MPNPQEYLQTHDPFGRRFSEPEPGGPIPGKLNLTFGEPKGGCDLLVSLQDDKQTRDLFFSGNHVPSKKIEEALRPITDKLEPYQAQQAYWAWFSTYVGDLDLDTVADQVVAIMGSLGYTSQER